MPAGNWFMYGPAHLGVWNGTIDLANDTFRIVLLGSGYTPAQTHAAWSSLSANELSTANGYTAGGQAIALTVTASGQVVTVDATDESWTASGTLTAKYAVIVRDADGNGTIASTDVPIAYCDLNDGGGSLSATDAPLSITMNASGIYTSTAATDS